VGGWGMDYYFDGGDLWGANLHEISEFYAGG